MRADLHALRSLHDRINGWVRPTTPVTYRDAWRFSLQHALILLCFTLGYALIGASIWPVYLVLVVPTMATFTLGFAIRRGSVRQRLLSLGIGVASSGGPLLHSTVREHILAIGAPGILMGWLFVLIGLFGYAFPEVGTVRSKPADSTDSDHESTPRH